MPTSASASSCDTAASVTAGTRRAGSILLVFWWRAATVPVSREETAHGRRSAHDHHAWEMEAGTSLVQWRVYAIKLSTSCQVCRTLEELEALADDLLDNKNKNARKLATTIMHEVVPPLFAQELVPSSLLSVCESFTHRIPAHDQEEEKVVQRQARSRRAGIDTR